jgi:hypothetical protein
LREGKSFFTAKAPRAPGKSKNKGANRRGAEVAEEAQRKAITAKARRRKEMPQRTSEFLIWFCFPLRPFAPLRLCGERFFVFLGVLGALAV